MFFMCVRLFMLFIRESSFIVCTKERLFMFFKFTRPVYKKLNKLILYYFYAYIFDGNFAVGCGPGTNYP
jgi:hypothetical protein